MDRLNAFVAGVAVALGITFTVLPLAAHAEASDGTIAVALPAVRTAASTAGVGKFCGKDLYHNPGKGLHEIRLTNLALVHARLAAARPFSDYIRRGAGNSEHTGYVLWGYDPKDGFRPIYFVPSNVPADEC